MDKRRARRADDRTPTRPPGRRDDRSRASRDERPERSQPFVAPSDRPSVGAIIQLTVSALTLSGEAIGKHGGYVLFISGAIPGERVKVEVVSTGQRYGRARVLEVLSPAPTRVTPKCRHFGVCGGCSWQHLDYAAQLRQKEELLRGTLAHRLPGVPLPMRPIIGMDDPWGTRNKVHFIVESVKGKPALGHYRAHSRDFIPVEECPVHHPLGNAVAGAMIESLHAANIPAFHEGGRGGIARHLLVRATAGQEAQATLVASRARFPGQPEFTQGIMNRGLPVESIHLNINPVPGPVVLGPHTLKLAGHPRVIQHIMGIDFLLSPTSFFQTNEQGARRLVETVLEFLPPDLPHPILDLYAGVGLFALPLGRRGHRVTAVEENPMAVGDGIESAKANRISTVRFLAGRMEEAMKRLDPHRPLSAVILDPPRDGCPEWALRHLVRQFAPPRIVDVSCDPTSLARDLSVLLELGYRLLAIQPIDMFPHTAHIETVVLLEREGDPGDGPSRERPRSRQRPRRRS